MPPLYFLALTVVLAYILGSIPFGVLIARALGLGDLRGIGSGNTGATNVLRTGSKKAALATLVLDAGKGAVAVLIAAALIGPQAAQLAALASFIGHLYPVWSAFKGGKGVATFLGILLALNPLAGAATCATWLIIAVIFRISSLSALIAAALSPLWLWLLGDGQLIPLCALLAAMIVYSHRHNIARLLKGQEPKIGNKTRS